MCISIRTQCNRPKEIFFTYYIQDPLINGRFIGGPKTQQNPNSVPNLGQIGIRMHKIGGQSSHADSLHPPVAVHSTSVAPDHGFAAPLSRRAASRRWRGEAGGRNRSRCDASHLGRTPVTTCPRITAKIYSAR